MVTSLKKREWSRDMSRLERYNLFGPDGEGLKNPHGYVRYIEEKNGIFYLDPSKNLKAVGDKIYFYQGKKKPDERALIKVTITETEPLKEPDGKGGLKVTRIFKVFTWETVNIKDILQPIRLMEEEERGLEQEEFLDFMSLSIRKKYLTPELKFGLCLYAVASPEVNEHQKGGINTTVLANYQPLEKWGKFKRITSVIPSEFRKPTSEHFYQNVDYNKKYQDSDFLNSKAREISIAYHNDMAVPVEIPLPLNVEFRTVSAIKEDFKIDFSAGRSFILDTLLFEPVIPESESRYVLDAIYEFSYNFRAFNYFAYFENTLSICASILLKLTRAFARFNFEDTVNKENVDEALNFWQDLQKSVNKTGLAAKKFSGFYNLHTDEKIVLTDLAEMQQTGIETTIQNLKTHTKVNLLDIDDILSSLVRKHYIFFQNRNTIRFINQ
jgi:hypothetical protein